MSDPKIQFLQYVRAGARHCDLQLVEGGTEVFYGKTPQKRISQAFHPVQDRYLCNTGK